MTRGLLTRVWRESWGQWWAELWRPTDEDDPPSPFKPIDLDPAGPPSITGYKRIGLQLKNTRRGARKAAAEMLGRHRVGLRPEPGRDIEGFRIEQR